jgi:hypothetical protein
MARQRRIRLLEAASAQLRGAQDQIPSPKYPAGRIPANVTQFLVAQIFSGRQDSPQAHQSCRSKPATRGEGSADRCRWQQVCGFSLSADIESGET